MTTQKEWNRQWIANKRERLRADGLCVRCGKQAPALGLKNCRSCLDKIAAYRKKRKETGMCNRCGKHPKRPDGISCKVCHDKAHKLYLANRDSYLIPRRKRAGLCTVCGKRPPLPGTYQGKPRVSCAQCNTERNAKQLARRIKGVRYKALERDSFSCQLCGKTSGLTVHHIDGYGDTSGQPNDAIENLITLCRICHAPITNLRRKGVDRKLACKLIRA